MDGVVVEKYLWQRMTRLLAVYDGSDNLLMRFEYVDARMPVTMTSSDSTCYLFYDQIGSLRIVANASGNVVKKIDYDSFGNIINDTNPAFIVPFGFAGGLYDKDIGLVRFGFRDYDPDIGRWTAKDPILFWGEDIDIYGYVSNNPINFLDPWGLKTRGLGWTFSVGCGVGWQFQILRVGDDKGNLGWAITAGGSGYLGCGITSAITFQNTNADTIYDLGGLSGAFGGSLNIFKILSFGYEFIAGKDYTGSEYSVGIGPSYLPFALWSSLNYTWIKWATNWVDPCE